MCNLPLPVAHWPGGQPFASPGRASWTPGRITGLLPQHTSVRSTSYYIQVERQDRLMQGTRGVRASTYTVPQRTSCSFLYLSPGLLFRKTRCFLPRRVLASTVPASPLPVSKEAAACIVDTPDPDCPSIQLDSLCNLLFPGHWPSTSRPPKCRGESVSDYYIICLQCHRLRLLYKCPSRYSASTYAPPRLPSVPSLTCRLSRPLLRLDVPSLSTHPTKSRIDPECV